jgi:hypothetical protein
MKPQDTLHHSFFLPALGGFRFNMRLASCGVKCLNSSSVFQINFSAGLTVLCPEIPHERQAQKTLGVIVKRPHPRQRTNIKC